jgi:hypothetical protein
VLGKRRSPRRPPRWQIPAVDNSALVDPFESAKLPGNYEDARQALEKCARIDECKGWIDQAEAIKSYARQIGDDSLVRVVDRIYFRAIRRLGEMLLEIPDNNRGRPAKNRVDDRPNLTRGQAAAEIGLSEYQRKIAIRLASILEEQFEESVESGANLTELAELGTTKKPPTDDYLIGRLVLTGRLRRLAEFCAEADPERTAREFSSKQVYALRQDIKAIDRWLVIFNKNLPATPTESLPPWFRSTYDNREPVTGQAVEDTSQQMAA